MIKQCSVLMGQWNIMIMQWSLVMGQWSVVLGQWSVVIRQWSIVDGTVEYCYGQWGIVSLPSISLSSEVASLHNNVANYDGIWNHCGKTVRPCV